MSASPMARQVSGHSTGIPTRRVVIHHEHEMPSDYGTTPGGTIFGTTPGGTRIVYERAFLMHLRQSPLSRTPPKNLPNIPGVTIKKDDSGSPHSGNEDESNRGDVSPTTNKLQTVTESTKEEDDQFAMDL